MSSVNNQTYKDIEVIIVDDGSTDNSLYLIKKFIEDNRMSEINYKVITKTNEGVSIARNKGIQASKGCYITFLDFDDMLKENHVLHLINLNKDNNTNLSFSKIKRSKKNKAWYRILFNKKRGFG